MAEHQHVPARSRRASVFFLNQARQRRLTRSDAHGMPKGVLLRKPASSSMYGHNSPFASHSRVRVHVESISVAVRDIVDDVMLIWPRSRECEGHDLDKQISSMDTGKYVLTGNKVGMIVRRAKQRLSKFSSMGS